MDGNKRNLDHNVQFRFSEDALKRLDHLKDKSHLRTRADVVRNALRLYEYFIDRTEQGYSVQLVKGKEKETIVLFPC